MRQLFSLKQKLIWEFKLILLTDFFLLLFFFLVSASNGCVLLYLVNNAVLKQDYGKIVFNQYQNVIFKFLYSLFE